MSDRELLERAAKAAGLHQHKYSEAWKAMAAYTLQDGYYGPSWNPLTDDGDALRLAVKLHLAVNPFDGHVAVTLPGVNCLPIFSEEQGKDHCAATRRAIVRAAAALA